MRDKLVNAIRKPKKIYTFLRYRLLKAIIGFHNIVNKTFKNITPKSDPSDYVKDIILRSRLNTPISDHLPALFSETLNAKPKLIVELGVDVGHSTLALERAAKIMGAKLISVDIRDCSSASDMKNWFFIKSDDIVFGKKFGDWCKRQKIKPVIDVLFIDTSHEYEHTIKEIKTWFPYLSDFSKVFFHDTNLKEVYTKKDGTKGIAWNNNRGVIKALENYFGTRFDETVDFIDYRKGWIIRHVSHCNGLTILEKTGIKT